MSFKKIALLCFYPVRRRQRWRSSRSRNGRALRIPVLCGKDSSLFADGAHGKHGSIGAERSSGSQKIIAAAKLLDPLVPATGVVGKRGAEAKT